MVFVSQVFRHVNAAINQPESVSVQERISQREDLHESQRKQKTLERKPAAVTEQWD